MSDWHKRRYRARREAGLCVRCAAPVNGKARCEACLIEARRLAAAMRKRWRETGRCAGCGGPTYHFTYCLKCREASKPNGKRKPVPLPERLAPVLPATIGGFQVPQGTGRRRRSPCARTWSAEWTK